MRLERVREDKPILPIYTRTQDLNVQALTSSSSNRTSRQASATAATSLAIAAVLTMVCLDAVVHSGRPIECNQARPRVREH